MFTADQHVGEREDHSPDKHDPYQRVVDAAKALPHAEDAPVEEQDRELYCTKSRLLDDDHLRKSPRLARFPSILFSFYRQTMESIPWNSFHAKIYLLIRVEGVGELTGPIYLVRDDDHLRPLIRILDRFTASPFQRIVILDPITCYRDRETKEQQVIVGA